MNFQQELESLIALVSNVADSFTTTLFCADQQDQQLTLVSYYSLGHSVVADTVIPFGHGLVGWVASHCQAVNVSEFNRDTKTLQFYRKDEEIKSFMAVPVMGEELMGVLCIDSKQQYVFTPKLQKLLQQCADQAALVLKRQQEFARQQRMRASIETLHEYCAALHERSTRQEGHQDGSRDGAHQEMIRHLCRFPQVLIDYDHCAVCLQDVEQPDQFVAYQLSPSSPEGVRALPLSIEQSLTGIVLRKGEPLHLPDVNGNGRPMVLFSPDEEPYHLRSFLGVPLIYRGNVYGAMTFISHEPFRFARSDIQLTQVIGYQVVAALYHERTARRWHDVHLIDGLTGLPNRRAFEEQLDQRLTRVDANGNSLALLAIDPDNFITLNETVGYTAGDEFLVQLGRLLGSYALGGNLLARFDGGRFMLVIENLSYGDAFEVADKLRRTIEDTLFQSTAADKTLTVSIGVAFYPGDAPSKWELVGAVNRAVATAKRHGKNRVEYFTPSG